MAEKCACETGGPTLIFACSGGSDTPELGDRAARKLRDEKIGKMYCLSGIGGNVDLIIENTRAAGCRLLIDGCDTACGKKTMERAGITDFLYMQVTDLGFEKGSTAVTEENIERVAAKGRELLYAALEY
jgi:uncharacterized metal-binding protein